MRRTVWRLLNIGVLIGNAAYLCLFVVLSCLLLWAVASAEVFAAAAAMYVRLTPSLPMRWGKNTDVSPMRPTL